MAGAIVIVDTSVFLVVLGVPHAGNSDQELERVRAELADSVQGGDTLLLPVAVIVEAGNHIARWGDGDQRRKAAGRFVDEVRKAVAGETPFHPTPLPDNDTIASWLGDYPDHAMRGVGIGDLSIIHEWQSRCELHRYQRVRIWSLDEHLGGYDRQPD